MSDPDRCKNCDKRGRFVECFAVYCAVHENWFAQELVSRWNQDTVRLVKLLTRAHAEMSLGAMQCDYARAREVYDCEDCVSPSCSVRPLLAAIGAELGRET